jgi:hypothetical protein
MYAQFFHGSSLLHLPILALVVFLVVFGTILVRTLRRPASSFAREEALPLQDDANVGESS